jgi:hypothetical protein
MICHTSSSSYRNDLRIKTHTDNDTYHGSDPPAVRPSITRNISLRESPCGSSPMGVPHGSAVRDQKNRVLGTQSLDPTKAHIPPLTLVLSRVGSAQDHPPPTTLTTLQRLVVVPIFVGPHTFDRANAHSFDPLVVNVISGHKQDEIDACELGASYDRVASTTGGRRGADISLLFCTCGVRTTQMCTSYT